MQLWCKDSNANKSLQFLFTGDYLLVFTVMCIQSAILETLDLFDLCFSNSLHLHLILLLV